MNKLGDKEILVYFPAYLEQYDKLEKEYARIPSWRLLKQHRNLQQRGKLNKWYADKMREWDL